MNKIKDSKLMNIYKLIRKYVTVDLTRAVIIDGIMVIYSAILCIDCLRKGADNISQLALFNAIGTSCVMPILCYLRMKDEVRGIKDRILVNGSVLFQCLLYWNTFAVFLYTGSMGGTSIFLIFLAAPIGFYFFNLFYGFVFCFVFFIGMAIYMWTPLRYMGYSFPAMYYVRLPLMYLVEVIVCALAQYETVKAESKLQMALDEAERANRAKTEFLSNMSHEIRTPINAVLGMNEMILRDSSMACNDPPTREADVKNLFADINRYSINIESAGNNLLSIINDILDFSKIEAGKLEVVEADYKLSTILNDVSNMNFIKARESGLEFIVKVDEDLPDELHGDEVRVRQIITNILSNAVKYTKEGSVCMNVTADGGSVFPGDILWLNISVEDTGIGIKEEDINKLFTKFQRVDLQSNSTVEGTGLGLAITHNLLERMGGEIRVESTYGQGSTFTVRIPQRVVSEGRIGNFQERFRETMNGSHNYVESFNAKDARILVVDDTRMNLMVVCGLLKNTGLKIDTAISGAEAIEMSKVNVYDIILMDQRMPGMGGTEAMQYIKNDYNGINCETPIICLTADAVSGARERYLSEGFTDYISKPIDYKALEKMLIKYLPADKIVSGPYLERDTESKTDDFDLLKREGIDVASGLKYCQEDPMLYRSVIEEYVDSHRKKAEEIWKHYNDKNWEDYGILVHSLKSTSRMIGADDLAKEAEEMEKAARRNDEEAVVLKTQAVMDHYDAVTDILRSYVGERDIMPEREKGVILEFSPNG